MFKKRFVPILTKYVYYGHPWIGPYGSRKDDEIYLAHFSDNLEVSVFHNNPSRCFIGTKIRNVLFHIFSN
jgi:hypothetical protein